MAAARLDFHQRHLLSHPNAVYWVAFSIDGTQLASGGLDRTVRLWSVADGRLERTLSGHGDGVAFVDYLNDGRIVTASLDRSLRIFSATGTLETTLGAHEQYLTCGAVARTQALLASGGWDKTVRLWDAATATPLSVLEGHDATVQTVAFSPDGATLASGGDDASIRLWNVESKSLVRTLLGHTGTAEALAFSPRADLLVSGGADGSVRFWRMDGTALADFGSGSPRVKSLAFSPDGTRVAVGGSDGALRLFSVADRNEPGGVSAHKNTVYSVAFSPDGKLLASAGFDRTIRVWEAVGG
jgi:WD40 repeat protein